jgi:hypothetical protein
LDIDSASIDTVATSTKTFDTENFLSKLQSIVALANRPGTPGENQAAVEALKRMWVTAEREAAQLPSYESKRFLDRAQAIIDSVGKPGASSTGSKRTSPPPPPSKPPFTTGWAWNFKKNKIGKIVVCDLRTSTYAGKYWNFTVETPTGGKENWWANECRKATQEEVDAATASKAGHTDTAEAKAKSGAKAKEKEKAKAKASGSVSDWKIFGFARCQEGTSNKVYGYASDGITWVTFWGKFAGPYTVKAQTNMRDAVATFDKKVKEKYAVCTADSGTQAILDAALAKSGLHSAV